MKKLTKLSIAIFFIAIGSVLISEYTSPASSNVAGAIAGVCGDPAGGKLTCNQPTCHTGGPTPPTVVKGWITTNVPNTGYVPNNTYTITAKIPPMPGHVRFGFEISPQNIKGTAYLGTLIVTDPTNTQLVSGAPEYITHKQAGTSNGKDSISWSFNWTAPIGGNIDSVIFYGAFNITNNDGLQTGDTIYTTTTTVKQDPTTGISEINASNNITVFPNPVKDKMTISNSQLSESMQVTIIDIYGKTVKELGNVNNNQSFYVGDLTSGYYGLKIETNAGMIYKNFIKE